MTLTGKQFKELHKALLSAFTYSTLQMMLRTNLERYLDQITRSADLNTVVYDLISAAEREGWVNDLVREAHNEVPGNSALAAVAASLSPPATTTGGSGRTRAVADPSTLAVPPIDPDNPPILQIRTLLRRSYSAETLQQFCNNRAAFREILRRVGPNEGLDGVIDEVLEYCRTNILWETLLAEVAKEKAGPYQLFLKEIQTA